MKFTATNEQENAFAKVEKAIREAKKIGLVFYRKSGNLVAYTKQAVKYIDNNGFQNCFGTMCSQIPCITKDGLIDDSGADDYPQFISESDEKNYM